jgi:membrane associated rhomboid family serine protease
MIPLADSSRRPLEFPAVTAWLIAINVVAFGLELLGGDEFVLAWSATPAVIAAGRDWATLLTAMFLHGGVMHILGNMVFFWAFAPVVEDAMGRGRFLAFYLVGGLVAFIAQIAFDPRSTIPNLGASGAIAAVMGAFLVRYPHDRIKTLVPIGPFLTLMSIPAALLIGLWLLIQMLNEVGSLALSLARRAGASFQGLGSWMEGRRGSQQRGSEDISRRRALRRTSMASTSGSSDRRRCISYEDACQEAPRA